MLINILWGLQKVILNDGQKIHKNLKLKDYYFDKYNWVPSLPGYEYDTIYMSNLRRKYDLTDQLPGYADLRTSFPQIKSLNNLPFNPIISVIYILHYQLLKNNLPIFPPSVMYVYRNITFEKC